LQTFLQTGREYPHAETRPKFTFAQKTPSGQPPRRASGAMFLTKCAACAADLAAGGKQCGRCRTAYCSVACQTEHWKAGHSSLCKMIKKKGGAEQVYADRQYKAAVGLAVDRCALDFKQRSVLDAAASLEDLSFCDADQRKRFLELSSLDAEDVNDRVCYICLDAFHEKEGLVRGCGCKGTSGYAHVTCLARLAQTSVEEGEAHHAEDMPARWRKWSACTLCDSSYHGRVSSALGWACWKAYLRRPNDDPAKRAALTTLGSALIDGDRCPEALIAFQTQLQHALADESEEDIVAAKQNVAMCYSRLGRDKDAIILNRELYAKQRKAHGPDHVDALVAALALANSFRALSLFSDARALLREVVPAAMATLGGDHGVTLELNANFVRAMSLDLNATPDQLKAAVALGDSTYQAARRVYGESHELTSYARSGLADARVVAQNAGLEERGSEAY